MPPKRRGRSTPSKATGSAGKTVLAFVLGAAAAAGAGYLYLHSGARSSGPQSSRSQNAGPQSSLSTPPAEVAQPNSPLPQSPHPAPRTAPFGTSEDVFEAGAHLYAARCSSCHGTPIKDASSRPPAHQFWREARAAAAREAPGDLYAQIAAGSPAKGMPAYAHILTDTQIWQLALLLKNADQDLPDPVVNLLNTPPKP